MKKFLLGSIVLTVFALSIIVFQISCQKSASAQSTTYTLPAASSTAMGGVIVGSGLTITNAGVLSVTPSQVSTTQLNKIVYKKIIGSTVEIWTTGYDGTNNSKVNIILPSGIGFSDNMNPIMSPNGTKIFFTAGTAGSFAGSYNGDLYSCNNDGSTVTKIVDRGGSNNQIILGGAY